MYGLKPVPFTGSGISAACLPVPQKRNAGIASNRNSQRGRNVSPAQHISASTAGKCMQIRISNCGELHAQEGCAFLKTLEVLRSYSCINMHSERYDAQRSEEHTSELQSRQ